MNIRSVWEKVPFLHFLAKPWQGLSPVQKKQLTRAFLLALVVRFGFILLAYISTRVLDNPFQTMPKDLNGLFSFAFGGWDALHYRHIAENWYSAYSERYYAIAYFPLYPVLMAIAGLVIPNIVFAGCAVSFLASVAAGYLLQELIRLEFADDSMSERALLFLFLFPTAYFMAVPYSEALFLALVLWTFVAAQKGQWFWVGLAGILATATRLNGLLLLPAIAYEALRQEREATFKKAFWIFFIPLGFVVYLLINWQVWGDPYAFLGVQKAYWDQHFISPWAQIADAISHLSTDIPSGARTMNYETKIVSIIFTMTLLIGSIRWLKLSYQIYAWGSFVLFMGASNLISLPRYILMIFPLFIVLAKWVKSPWLVQLITVLFTLLLACYFMFYCVEFWAF